MNAIHFSASAMLMLDVILALMMFAVALSLRVADFKHVVTAPRAPIVGLITRLVLLPAASCGLTWALDINPAMALGMILVVSCPGGTFSNIMSWIGRANVAVSVSITAISTVLATLTTPLNFAFYGWLNPHTRTLVKQIALNPWHVAMLVLLILGLPLVIGMLVGHRWPRFVERAQRPLRMITVVILFVFVAIAFINNFQVFLANASTIVWLVVLQNLMALGLGYVASLATGLSRADRRAVTLEVGIQNSGLGLAVLFTFFPYASGMILITALWGVWDLLTGLCLALAWSRYPRSKRLQETTA